MHSEELDALNVRLSDAEVTELMTAVNETWAQAGIIWSVESIVHEDARNESLFRRALTDPTESPLSVLTSVLTFENLRPSDVERGLIPECANVRSSRTSQRGPRGPLRHRA